MVFVTDFIQGPFNLYLYIYHQPKLHALLFRGKPPPKLPATFAGLLDTYSQKISPISWETPQYINQ